MNSEFALKLFEPVELKQINLPDKRVYEIETGEQFISVTTALNCLFNESSLTEWRDAVGDEFADQYINRAARYGTAIHNIAEEYILGKLNISKLMPTQYSRFKILKPYLDNNITDVYGVELKMFSRDLHAAGTSDLICKYKNKNSILDYKTSNRRKSIDEILTYFIQSTAYAIMVKELYNFDIEQIVILLYVHEDTVLEFIEPIDKYLKMTRQFFKLFHKGKFK
jgi:genome maintenance exonuclease 1